MRAPDLDLERCERELTASEFIAEYNKNLPDWLPEATPEILRLFKKQHPDLFKNERMWSLDRHRKKMMDWHPEDSRVLG